MLPPPRATAGAVVFFVTPQNALQPSFENWKTTPEAGKRDPMHLIDRIAHTNRWSHHPTTEKLLLCLGGLVVCLIGPAPFSGGMAFTAACALALGCARLPLKAFIAVLGLPLGFLLVSLPMLMVSVTFTGGLSLGWRPDQAIVALSLFARAAGATAWLTLLVLTTPAHAMIPCLRRIGVPAFLVEIMLLTYRLIFVFAETAAAGYHAQAARLGHT
ncbi:MAG: hypothetical protein JXQ84_03440, partial [Rhodospirillaceae bacterium]|nr:hypothetical protein [Rhodospirillaceae bacterium]